MAHSNDMIIELYGPCVDRYAWRCWLYEGESIAKIIRRIFRSDEMRPWSIARSSRQHWLCGHGQHTFFIDCLALLVLDGILISNMGGDTRDGMLSTKDSYVDTM